MSSPPLPPSAEEPRAIQLQLARQLTRLVVASGVRDIRAELAEAERLFQSLLEQRGLMVELVVEVMQGFLLLRRPAVAKQAVAVLRRTFKEDPLLERIAGHLSADVPSEADMIRAIYAFKALRYDWLYDSSHRELRVALSRLLPRLRLGGMSRIVDLGCGTGLVGGLLREHGFAGRLTGVDLSRDMLEVASKGGRYDELVEDDLVRYLDGTTTGFDAITTLQVVAILDRTALDALLAGARRRLGTGGALVFNAPGLGELADAGANEARATRLGPGTVEVLLRQHRLAFRASNHGGLRYYIATPRGGASSLAPDRGSAPGPRQGVTPWNP
jgi:SAM-dependent methyltransferase